MAKVKKVPLRKCAGCQQMKEKKDLIRVIRTPEGEIEMDTTGRRNGRGVYLCPSMDCLNRARKARALERSLGTSVSAEIYGALEEEIKNIEEQ
jgi:hypothetical protein